MKENTGLTAWKILHTNTWEDSPQEYSKVISRRVWQLIEDEAAQKSQTDYYKNRDFYIGCFINREAKITNMPRHRIFARRTMPGPFYHLAIWKYHHVSGTLEFMWYLPSKQVVTDIVMDVGKAIKDGVSPKLIQDSLDAVTGKLEKLAISENGAHKKDALILMNQPNQLPHYNALA